MANPDGSHFAHYLSTLGTSVPSEYITIEDFTEWLGSERSVAVRDAKAFSATQENWKFVVGRGSMPSRMVCDPTARSGEIARGADEISSPVNKRFVQGRITLGEGSEGEFKLPIGLTSDEIEFFLDFVRMRYEKSN